MSVHYKFKSALDYDTVTFDGLHISVGDLKSAISQQKRIGKTSDFDLEITNAQTKEVYVDDHTLIPKNTSLLVARVPLSQQPKKHWEGSNSSSSIHKDVAPNKGLADLSRMEGSEQDKINAMITQSTFDYDPSNYQKIKGQNQRGVVPPNYTCYKCQKHGHWIKDCPLANSGDSVEIRRSTGIPRSFMVPVEGPKAPGAMMTPSGTFAVPAVDREAYLASENAGGGDTPTNAPAAPETTVPDELICSLCRDLLTDAVMIPCCGNSFCDECIRGALLESEDHECPDCREKEIAPTTLIPNRFLRNSVSSFRNQTGYSRRMPHRIPAVPPPQPVLHLAEPVAHGPPPNGPSQHPGPNPAGPPPGLKPPGIDGHPAGPIMPPRLDEQRSSTPTVDERREPLSQPGFGRGPPPGFIPGGPPPARPYNNGRPFLRGPPGTGPYPERFRREPFQPPPPGIKDSPNGRSEDPIEAFNRMIREKEMRAKRREEERRRVHSGSRSPRSRSPRSPPSPRPPRSSRSPRPPRSPRLVRSSRSPRPPRSSRSPRPPRSPRSPRLARSPRSPRSPRARPRSRGSSRLRYSRSRSLSRGRVRRSPWSPRRRRTRERTLSLTRSPSPRRRHRSPMRYRSPLRSPPRSPPRSLPRSPPRSLPRSPPRSLPRSPPRSLPRSPPRSPHRGPMRSPPPRSMSPHRYAGVYDELLSPPRRNVEPPYGARFGRNNGPPPTYPLLGVKPVPPLMGTMVVPVEQPPPGYRGRFEGPPSFEDIPPGVEPPVPGFEPPPFEKPPFGPPGVMDRDRLPPPNYRDPYGPRPPYGDGPNAYRDMPLSSAPNEIPVHVGEPPRFRENFRPGLPYREGPPPQFREGQPFREVPSQGPYRDPNYRGPPPPFRDAPYRNVPFREPGFRENVPHNTFREGGPPFRPPNIDSRDPRGEPVPSNYHDPNFRDAFREEVLREHGRPGYRASVRSRGGPRRNPNVELDRHREREGHDRERYNDARETERVERERARDIEKRGREGRTREYERGRDYEKERDHERNTPDKKSRGSPKRSKDGRDRRRSESRGRSRERDRDSKKEKKEERNRDKSSAERSKDHKDKDKKIKDRKKKKREKEKESDKKKKRDKKEKKEKDHIKKEEGDAEVLGENVQDSKVQESIPNVKNEKNDDVPPVVEQKEVSDTVPMIIKKEKSLKVELESKPLADLYGDEASEAVDKEIIQNYVKAEENDISSDKNPNLSKDEPFDGIELQANVEELDLKPEPDPVSKEMLAPLPALSKWEVDDENADKAKEPGEITPEEEEDAGKVTSDVIKRAENAIFAKAISSLRPIEIKKISKDRLNLYSDENAKSSMNNIQITVPAIDSDQRSIEINERKKRFSKTPPPRLSVKERLGGKVEDVRRGREPRVVQSTVERVKSRSKTPKKEQPYRRVTVEKERSRKHEPSGRPEPSKSHDKHRARSPREHRETEKRHKDDKKINEIVMQSHEKNASNIIKNNVDRERKKSTLDEAHFEPDYDENVESDTEAKEDTIKKRERSASPGGNEAKKAKIETETIKLDLANVKKKPDTESESTSGSDDSSSSSSDDARKRKKKKKRSKKKKKRAASDSESESDSSSDDHKKKKKKRKHKKKSSKKKKKSKHK